MSSKAIAKNIVAYREENGRFTNRRQLLKVAKLGPKAFEQCAGFMRITGRGESVGQTPVCIRKAMRQQRKLLKKLGYTDRKISQQAAYRTWQKG